MTQEEKQLLLIDLSARLPYGVKVKYAIPTLLVSIKNDRDGIKVITEGTYGEHIYNIEDIKPYLRPMSSMTEEEINECYHIQQYTIHVTFDKYDEGYEKAIDLPYFESLVDFYNSHHLDYRGLIEKDIALVAPDGIYK